MYSRLTFKILTVQIFKAFWTQVNGELPWSNNPFGEILIFVVLRPHKRHSICLYRNIAMLAVTANYAPGPFTRITIKEPQRHTPELRTTLSYTLGIKFHL
jgi:hypothetical protein